MIVESKESKGDGFSGEKKRIGNTTGRCLSQKLGVLVSVFLESEGQTNNVVSNKSSCARVNNHHHYFGEREAATRRHKQPAVETQVQREADGEQQAASSRRPRNDGRFLSPFPVRTFRFFAWWLEAFRFRPRSIRNRRNSGFRNHFECRLKYDCNRGEYITPPPRKRPKNSAPRTTPRARSKRNPQPPPSHRPTEREQLSSRRGTTRNRGKREKSTRP